MTCQLTFLPVGNADSIVIQADESTVIVDMGKLDVLEDWLEENQASQIDRVYITHEHRDHFPNLVKLKDFLEEWKKKGTVAKVHLPYRVFEIAERTVVASPNNPRNRTLGLALKKIKEWSASRNPSFSPVVRDGETYSQGSLNIEALHPSQDYVESHLAHSNSKLNEISTVLRINYGNFSTLLLADIEGAGLTELLDFLKMCLINCETDDAYKTNVVKIPHHGAYPKNGHDLEELLALVDAKFAVLSVGSKNKHGHVKPELFQALIDLKNDEDKRLEQFICTEVTRTCTKSASERSAMLPREGLKNTKKCAGEITIVARTSGTWELVTETVNHQSKVRSLTHAACDGRADL